MRYELTGNAAFMAFLLTIIAGVIVFWFIPMIRWKVEKQKTPLASLRTFVSMGKTYGLRIGGVFYRVTAYDDFLIIVMFWPEVIKYRDIKSLKLDEGIAPKLSMVAHGVPIRIYGSIYSLQEIQKIISSKS